MTYKQWDIVLVTFPFTDLTKSKKRPGLIISPDEYNNKGNDVIIAFITSNMKTPDRLGDYKIKQWKKSGLPKPSLIRMKFTTISKEIIFKRIGKLTPEDRSAFRNNLIALFS